MYLKIEIAEILPHKDRSNIKIIFERCIIDISTLQRLLKAGIKEIRLSHCELTGDAWRYELQKTLYYSENVPCDTFLQPMCVDYPCIFLNKCFIAISALEELFSANAKKLFTDAGFNSPYDARKFSYTIIFEQTITQPYDELLIEECIEADNGLRRTRP